MLKERKTETVVKAGEYDENRDSLQSNNCSFILCLSTQGDAGCEHIL